jgi:hypothetical protein
MLITRDYDFQRDHKEVDRIWREHHSNDFGIASLDNTIIRRVVEVDGKMVAYGFAKLNPEATLILDLNEPRRVKVQALRALMFDAIRGCKEHNLSQLHAVIKDRPEYLKLLKKHYGFKDTNGTMVIMEIE